MIPLPEVLWFLVPLAYYVICAPLLYLIDARQLSIWIGATPGDLATRLAVAILTIVLVRLNVFVCAGYCFPWLALMTVLLCLLALAGGGTSALWLSVSYLLFNILVLEYFNINRGVPALVFPFFFYVLALIFAFVHVRERVPLLRTIPIPSGWVELSNRAQHIWWSLWLPPQPRQHRVLSAPVAGRGLYLLSLLLEGMAALVRSAVYFVASLILLSPFYLFLFISTRNSYLMPAVNVWGAEIGGWTIDHMRWFTTNLGICLLISTVVGLGLGYWPLLRSLFHTFFPYTRSGAGEQERDALGAREPTRAEHQKIIDTLVSIHATASLQEVAVPSTWLVIDAPTPDAYTIGSTVYVTRAAIEDAHFAGIVAHELGHLAHKDGDLILALRRFVIPLAYFVGVDRQPTPAGAVWARGSGVAIDVIRNQDEKIFYRFKALQIKLVLAFWFGGLGMFFLGQEWARFWRGRDFLADDYAVELGQADSLMGILKTYQHVDVAQPFLLSNRPYTAERLDRLQG